MHPSGNYNRRAPWSIPKVCPTRGKTLNGQHGAKGLEETGVVACELVSLGSVTLTKSRKQIHCFAGPSPADAVPRCAGKSIGRNSSRSTRPASCSTQSKHR